MTRSIWRAYLDAIFCHGCFIIRRTTKGKPAPAPLFFYRYDRHSHPRNIKGTIPCLGKWKNGASFPFVCRWGSNTRGFNFRSELQNWVGHRGNTACSHHHLICVWAVIIITSLYGSRIGQCNSHESFPCVFRDVRNNFHFSPRSWTTIFGAVIYMDLRPKKSPKKWY